MSYLESSFIVITPLFIRNAKVLMIMLVFLTNKVFRVLHRNSSQASQVLCDICRIILHVGRSTVFWQRAFWKRQGKGGRSPIGHFSQEPPQSVCILTHWCDDTTFPKRRGSIKDTVRTGFASLGSTHVSPCHEVSSRVWTQASRASGQASWLCWVQLGQHSRRLRPFPAK